MQGSTLFQSGLHPQTWEKVEFASSYRVEDDLRELRVGNCAASYHLQSSVADRTCNCCLVYCWYWVITLLDLLFHCLYSFVAVISASSGAHVCSLALLDHHSLLSMNDDPERVTMYPVICTSTARAQSYSSA